MSELDAMHVSQPNTGERCPRCDGEGTDPYFDGACQGVAHQLDVSADQPNTERCPAGICVREAGHAGPHTDDPRLAISAVSGEDTP